MKHYLRQHGSALIILIVTIVVMSALGIAILSMRTASSYTQMNTNTSSRAYYLAESGRRYANFSTADGSGTTGKTYRLSNGDEIQLTIDSTGFITSGSTFYKDTALESVRIISGPKKNGMPCWSFDDPNPQQDNCSSNNISNSITTINGRFGKALQCNGTAWAETPFKPIDEIGSGKPSSVSFWVKPQNTGDQVIFGTSDGTTPPRRFSVGISGGKWYWAYGDTIKITPIIADTRWQKVMLVYFGSAAANQITLYVSSYDCTIPLQSDTGTVTNALLPMTVKKLFICGEHNSASTTSLFNGLVDELRIYDRALTLDEITPPCDAGCNAAAYYPFDGDAKDKSGLTQAGHGNDGVLSSSDGIHLPTHTTDRFGCSDKAYYFDATYGEYIHVPYASANTSLDLTTEGTLAAWIYISTFKDYAGIIHKGDKKDFTDEAYSLKFCKDGFDCPADGSKRIRFAIIDLGKIELDSVTVFDPGKWYHVAATWNASLLKLYVNGVSDNTAANTIGAARSTDGGLNIGSQLNEDFDATVKNFPFHGKIDDVLIFNRALSDVEIAALAADKP